MLEGNAWHTMVKINLCGCLIGSDAFLLVLFLHTSFDNGYSNYFYALSHSIIFEYNLN